MNVCVVIIFAIISMIVVASKSKDLSFLLNIDPNISDNVRFLTYIVLYSQFIPIAIYAILDCVRVGSAWIIERRMKKLNQEGNSYFAITNPSAFSSLGQIDYLFLDKIGAPFSGEKEICRVMVMQEDYIFNPAELHVQAKDIGKFAKEAKAPRSVSSPAQTIGNVYMKQELDTIHLDDIDIPSESNLTDIFRSIKQWKAIDNQIIF